MDIEYRGYYPGMVGEITKAHAVYYFDNWGFDVTFETQVGKELSEFVRHFEETRDGLWVGRIKRVFAGAIAVDGRNAYTEGARLRWFIVEPAFQKRGIGKGLLTEALEFCRKMRYPQIYLWTFKGLEDARRVYEAVNFRLCEEHDVAQWGQQIREQKYVLRFTYDEEEVPD